MIDGIYSVKIDGDDASAILETRMTLFTRCDCESNCSKRYERLIFYFEILVYYYVLNVKRDLKTHV